MRIIWKGLLDTAVLPELGVHRHKVGGLVDGLGDRRAGGTACRI